MATTLSREFGSHSVSPEEMFPRVEEVSFGSLGKELLMIFKEITIPETWIANHDVGNFAACHESVRGRWKEDGRCTVVLVAGIGDNLFRVGGFCWLGFFTEEEWTRETGEATAQLKKSRKEDPKAVREGRMPKRDPVIGLNLSTGFSRKGSDTGFAMEWANARFHDAIRSIRDRLVAAGYEQR